MFDDSSPPPADDTPSGDEPTGRPSDPGTRALSRMLDAILGRVTPSVTLILIIVTAVAVGSYLAGLAALSGGIRTVWIVLGALFGFIAIRGLVRLRWNLAAIGRHRSDVVNELIDLRQSDPQADSVVIDMIETTESDDVRYTRAGYSGASGDFTRIGRNLEGFTSASSPWLTRLVTTAKRGVVAVLTSIALALVFAFLALIFLIALAL